MRTTPSKPQEELLRELAVRYVWWKKPSDALRYPYRIVAQVMNLGDWDDVVKLMHAFDVETLRDVLQHAEAGQFNDRSWHFWHYRLGMASRPGDISPLPVRFPASE